MLGKNFSIEIFWTEPIGIVTAATLIVIIIIIVIIIFIIFWMHDDIERLNSSLDTFIEVISMVSNEKSHI